MRLANVTVGLLLADVTVGPRGLVRLADVTVGIRVLAWSGQSRFIDSGT